MEMHRLPPSRFGEERRGAVKNGPETTLPPMTLPRDFVRRYRDYDAKAHEWAQKRDALVAEAREHATLREIAEALGISHTMVAKIERRAEGEQP